MAIDNVKCRYFNSLFKCCLESSFFLSKNVKKDSLYYVQQILRTNHFISLFEKELSIMCEIYVNVNCRQNQHIRLQHKQFFEYAINFLEFYMRLSTLFINGFIKLIENSLQQINFKGGQFQDEMGRVLALKNKIELYIKNEQVQPSVSQNTNHNQHNQHRYEPKPIQNTGQSYTQERQSPQIQSQASSSQLSNPISEIIMQFNPPPVEPSQPYPQHQPQQRPQQHPQQNTQQYTYQYPQQYPQQFHQQHSQQLPQQLPQPYHQSHPQPNNQQQSQNTSYNSFQPVFIPNTTQISQSQLSVRQPQQPQIRPNQLQAQPQQPQMLTQQSQQLLQQTSNVLLKNQQQASSNSTSPIISEICKVVPEGSNQQYQQYQYREQKYQFNSPTNIQSQEQRSQQLYQPNYSQGAQSRQSQQRQPMRNYNTNLSSDYDRQQNFFQRRPQSQQQETILQMEQVKESYQICPPEPIIQEFQDPHDRNYTFGGAIFPVSSGQPYSSVQLFLNNHFFILREDYMKDFRRQVQKLKETGFSNVSRSVVSSLFLYYDVIIENMLVTNKGFQFVVSMTAFDPRKNNKINWQKTNRLMPGSLLLLSTTKLEFMLFGTVFQKPEADRGKRVSIGITLIGVQIEKQLEQVNILLNQKDQLIIIENQVYFEAYIHFLKCVQNIEPSRFPFQKQIVLASKDMPLPGYLDAVQIQNQGIVYDIDLKFDLHKRSQVGKIQRVNILREWPKIENESLDESQLKAVQIMLKNGISLIQGPPGTGKTYCGALGVRILLQNQFKWNPNYIKRNKPILIVCQTNHALDQFLMHIQTFCRDEDIVRIGGRCKIPEFKNILLQSSQEQRKIRFNWKQYLQLRDELDRKLRHLLNFVDNIHYSDVKKFQPNVVELIVKDYLQTEDAQFQKRLSEESQKMLVHMWLDTFKPQDEHFYKLVETEQINNNRLINNRSNRGAFKGVLKFTIGDISEPVVQLSEKAQQKLQENEYDGVDENEQIDSDKEEDRKIINQFSSGDQKNEFISKLISDKKSMRRLLNRLGRDNEKNFNELMKSITSPDYNIWRMWQSQRNTISRYIFTQKFNDIYSVVKHDIEEYEQYIQELNDAYIRRDLDYIQQKKIVGVTLAGCAKYAEKLGHLDCNIMIVEEAGEVLESNLIAVLSKNINHLILIGDHQQLKPSLNSYDLEIRFKANISLFERLVKNGLEYATLSYQRRMKSEFADFIRLIYSDYRDHADIQIQNKMKIKGLKHDILFYSHKEQENQDEFSSSKSNSYEVEMIYRLTEYLIKNGTKEHQITILTTYGKQALILKKRMGPKYKVQTIDNYQGEENDIILLSLVRANNQNKLGFVAIDNRVCVALSRARLALYIFGNFGFIENCLYEELSKPLDKRTQNVTDLWLKILSLASNKNILLDHICLECSSHNEITKIFNLRDWERVKNGGCQKKCNIKFPCGHICQDICHIYDHKQQNCRSECGKQLNCGHYCISKCNVIPCPPCREKIERELPGCKHKVKIDCSMPINKALCFEKCTKIVACGHQCSLQCRDNCNNNRCQVLIKVAMELCKHIIQIKCDDKNYVSKMFCTEICGKKLQCGHNCGGQCGKCLDRFHSPCGQKCDKVLYCGHKCKMMCSVKCYECKEKCQVYCNCKIRCSNTCQRVCKKCELPCKLRCEHSVCTKSCWDICDRKPCEKPCSKTLPCGCDCLGLCGEECPNICYDESHTQNENTAKNTLYYKLECEFNHIFEVAELDEYFNTLSVKQLLKCPRCQTIIWRSNRYQNFIKQSLNHYNEFKDSQKKQMYIDENRIEELEILLIERLNFVKQYKLKDQNSFLDNIRQTLKNEKRKLNDDYDSDLSFQEYECIKNQLQVYEKAQKLNSIEISNKQFQVNKIVLLDNYLFNEEFQKQSYSSFWWKINSKLETLLLYYQIITKYEATKDKIYKDISFEIEDQNFFLEDTKIQEFEGFLQGPQQQQ